MLKRGEVEVLTGEELLTGCGGEVVAGTLPDRLAGVSTDSRSRAPGAVFVALKGKRFDGHDFAAAARNEPTKRGSPELPDLGQRRRRVASRNEDRRGAAR